MQRIVAIFATLAVILAVAAPAQAAGPREHIIRPGESLTLPWRDGGTITITVSASFVRAAGKAPGFASPMADGSWFIDSTAVWNTGTGQQAARYVLHSNWTGQGTSIVSVSQYGVTSIYAPGYQYCCDSSDWYYSANPTNVISWGATTIQSGTWTPFGFLIYASCSFRFDNHLDYGGGAWVSNTGCT